MKKTVTLAALLLAACGVAMAQGYTTLGVGISTPKGTLHVHSSSKEFYGPDTVPFGRNDGGEDSTRDPLDPTLFQYSQSSFHLTNAFTGTTLGDGFVIESYNYGTTLTQKETGDLKLKNNNAELILTSGGKVGVGAVDNSYKFNVDGSMHASSLSLGSGITCQGNAQIFGALAVGSGFFYGSDGTLTVGSGFSCAADGALKVKSLRVTTTDWPDYVFGGSHRLMSLPEVESYINANGHLPEIPSAAEAETEGVDLGEINKLLLQKVEELTLYVIDLHKQLNELKSNK